MKINDLTIGDQIALFDLALKTAEKIGKKLSPENYADELKEIAETLSAKIQFLNSDN